jgi:hypothetical protein
VGERQRVGSLGGEIAEVSGRERNRGDRRARLMSATRGGRLPPNPPFPPVPHRSIVTQTPPSPTAMPSTPRPTVIGGATSPVTNEIRWMVPSREFVTHT